MKDTINLTALIQQLQSKFNANVNPKHFIDAFTATILEGLAKDGNVTIKGFGKFIILPRNNEGGESHISKDDIRFIPDNELAETINQPFAFFDAVELDDDVTDEVLENTETINKPAEEKTEAANEAENSDDSVQDTNTSEDNLTTVTDTTEEVSVSEEPVDGENIVITKTVNPTETNTETEIIIEAEKGDTSTGINPQQNTSATTTEVSTSEKEPENNTAETVNTGNEDITSYESEEEHSSDKSWIWLIVFFIIGLAIGWSVPTFITSSTPEEIILHDTIYIEKTVKQEVAKDSAKVENPVAQQQKVVTDTVRANRFLTQMARKYYGNPEFWAYIYIENQDKLKNPNTIAPGTVVVIPPAEKYGIDSKSKESVNAATRKCIEILNKYEKK